MLAGVRFARLLRLRAFDEVLGAPCEALICCEQLRGGIDLSADYAIGGRRKTFFAKELDYGIVVSGSCAFTKNEEKHSRSARIVRRLMSVLLTRDQAFWNTCAQYAAPHAATLARRL